MSLVGSKEMMMHDRAALGFLLAFMLGVLALMLIHFVTGG